MCWYVSSPDRLWNSGSFLVQAGIGYLRGSVLNLQIDLGNEGRPSAFGRYSEFLAPVGRISSKQDLPYKRQGGFSDPSNNHSTQKKGGRPGEKLV
jgi:hypothetical protein